MFKPIFFKEINFILQECIKLVKSNIRFLFQINAVILHFLCQPSLFPQKYLNCNNIFNITLYTVFLLNEFSLDEHKRLLSKLKSFADLQLK